MKKVITYGTYDLLHYGHVRLLDRAKKLGDYLIVGVTSDDYDRQRGKINVRQTLEERIDAVRKTGIADKIIIEEYEGQKIDDIKKYDVDIFTVGSDWVGRFDYLKEYCEVVYLDRTEGVSSTQIRSDQGTIKLGLVGYSHYMNKIYREVSYVNGLEVVSLCSGDLHDIDDNLKSVGLVTDDYDAFLKEVDAVYIHSHPRRHYEESKTALERGKHVFCESPIALNRIESKELFDLASAKGCIMMESLRTAYSTAYKRMLLLVKGGIIGRVISVDAVCTSLRDDTDRQIADGRWGSLNAWGPTAMLPVFQLLGTRYKKKGYSVMKNAESQVDLYNKVDFLYDSAVASIRTGIGAKSESELIISGTKGYIYVPSPWWKMDYFEVRFEKEEDKKRYFYQLDGEGIRYAFSDFARKINSIDNKPGIEKEVTLAITGVIEDYLKESDVNYLR